MVMNVIGTELEVCGSDPVTGFYRDNCCNTGAGDLGVHTVCAIMTDDFLSFSKSAGNDLSTSRPEFGFKGLSDGDNWCLCAPRWQEAFEAGTSAPGSAPGNSPPDPRMGVVERSKGQRNRPVEHYRESKERQGGQLRFAQGHVG